ncbi:MAG: hypothetical protein MUE51_08410 [Thermoleophilia bacterium]|nr:hypothetical protein [Thermoleophilia bacterium]
MASRTGTTTRTLASAAAGLLLAALAADTAPAAVKVFADSSELALTTPVLVLPNTQTRVYRDYDIVVEPYRDAPVVAPPAGVGLRTGYRVRPRAGRTTGTIATSDSDCLRNPVVNDVVCSRFSTSIAINLRNSGKDDRVAIREYLVRTDLPGLYACARRSDLANVRAAVYLGGGDDRFEDVSSSVQCPEGDPDALGDGTIPADAAVARPWGMDLTTLEVFGEAGDDQIVLDAGSRATLRARGGGGGDRVVARGGDDDVEGGTGNDDLGLGAGRDRGNGGPGGDTIDGGAGDDTADGGTGDDAITGGAGIDVLRAGPGSDVVNGGDGDDVIRLDDDFAPAVPTPDEANCGAGRDTAFADEADNVLDCEVVIRHWYTDGLPASVTASAITISPGGGFLVPVRCPSQAGVRCTGTLTLRTPGTSAVLGQAGYDLAVGQEVSLGLQITGARPARIVATTSEQGQTRPRSAAVTLDVS